MEKIEQLISIPGMPGIRELLSTAPGKATVLSGVNGPLAAVIACETAAQGKKTLIVAENDLKAARLADDIRQLTGGEGSCLPGGEIDLTRAAGSLENSWRRLEALSAVSEGNVRILCAGAEATAQRMGRPEPFKALSLRLKPGDVFPPADLARRLSRMGYDRVEMVEGKGQFARRGSILDVYPPALSQGLRIEFFDDEIDGIRLFDCISQRSLGEAEEAVLTPAAEALLDEEEYPAAAERMRALQKPACTRWETWPACPCAAKMFCTNSLALMQSFLSTTPGAGSPAPWPISKAIGPPPAASPAGRCSRSRTPLKKRASLRGK